MFMSFDDIASIIVNANHSTMNHSAFNLHTISIPFFEANLGSPSRDHVAFSVSQNASLWDVHFTGEFAEVNPGSVARLNLLPNVRGGSKTVTRDAGLILTCLFTLIPRVPLAKETPTCPSCGEPLEETPGGGLGCMSCLLRAGIGSEEETVQDSTPDTPEGGMRFGVYEIDCREDGRLYELGRGAMGVTYRATDTSLQRKVALKIIKIDIAERSADARERFMREARAAAALRHENIATVHQFGMRLETGQYFYAMELIEGETLEERVRRAGPLDARHHH